MIDPDTRRLLIEQVAHTLNINLQPMLAEIVEATTRPCVVFRAEAHRAPSIPGEMDRWGRPFWDIEKGKPWYADACGGSVRGWGDTPEEAMANFDRMWRGK